MSRKKLHVFMIDGVRLATPEIIDWTEEGPYKFKKRATGVKTIEAVLAPDWMTAEHLRWSDQKYGSWTVVSRRQRNSRWWNPLDGLDPQTQAVAAPKRFRRFDVWL